MRPITEIIIHCTATRPEWMVFAGVEAQRDEIDRWHKARKPPFKMIGYHFLIDRGGRVAVGRQLEQTGAHVAGRNTGTIGIALSGGHGSSETDQFADNFTGPQDVELRRLIADLRRRFPTIERVTGHNQYAAKACPGFNVPKWERGASMRPSRVKETPKPEHVAPVVLRWWHRLLARWT